MACTAPLAKSNVDTSDYEPTIVYHRTESKNAPSSYKANVSVYQSNNRSPQPPELRRKYSIAVKMIGDILVYRMDYPGDQFMDGIPRIITNDGSNMRLYNGTTRQLIMERPVSQPEASRSASLAETAKRQMALFAGRLDVQAMLDSYRSLSFDVAADSETNTFQVKLPLSGMSSGKTTYKSARMSYDLTNQCFAGSAVSYLDEQGVTVTLNTTPLYQEKDGILIKTGEVLETSYDYPERIDTSDSYLPRVDDMSSLPVLTDKDIADLAAEGRPVVVTPLQLGDPSDLDNTITEVRINESIEVDTLDDSYFRISL
jgi:hypothetical protein